MREGHQFAGSVERIRLEATVTERFVLHSSADFVEHEIGELDDVERVSDLDGATI